MAVLILLVFSSLGSGQEEPLDRRLKLAQKKYEDLMSEVVSLYQAWNGNSQRARPKPTNWDCRPRHGVEGFDPEDQKKWGVSKIWEEDYNQDGLLEQAAIRFFFSPVMVRGHFSNEGTLTSRLVIFHPDFGQVLDESFQVYDGFCWVELLSEYPGKEIILWKFFTRGAESPAPFSSFNKSLYQLSILVWQDQDYHYLYRIKTKNEYLPKDSAGLLLREFREYWEELESLRKRDAEEIFATTEQAIRHYFLLNQDRADICVEINPWQEPNKIKFKELYSQEDRKIICLIYYPGIVSSKDIYFCKKGPLGWRAVGTAIGHLTASQLKKWGLQDSEIKTMERVDGCPNIMPEY